MSLKAKVVYILLLVPLFLKAQNQNSISALSYNNTESNNKFIWGINGHTLNQEAYLFDIDQQLRLIQEAGISYYRIDMPLDSVGKVLSYRRERMTELLVKAKKKNIAILPMVSLAGLSYNSTIEQAYATGEKVGSNFSADYADFFNYYELGNEQEIQDGVMLPGTSGQFRDDYNEEKMKILSAYYRGMINGIKQMDPDALTIIDNSGWLHYMYFDILIANNVSFDILGYHFYSNMGMLTDVNNGDGSYGNMIEKLTKYGKPIWITEINRRYGSLKEEVSSSAFAEDENKEIAQSQWIRSYADEIKKYDIIKGFFIYELYDQPVFAIKKVKEEAEYGVIKWNDKEYKEPIRKPAYYTIKFIIEEEKYGNEDFYNALIKYGETHNNTAISNIDKLDKKKLLDIYLKQYYYDAFTRQQYMVLLDRQPTDNEIAKARKILKKNNGNEKLIKAIALSKEFKSSAGNTKQGFSQRLYQRLTRSYSQTTGNITSEKKILQDIIQSDHYIKIFINSQYNSLYNRNSTIQEEQLWLNRIKSGITQQEFIKNNLLSQEFWDNAIITGYENRQGIPFYVN